MKLALFIFIIFAPAVNAKQLCEIYSWMSCPDAFAASRSTTNSSSPTNSAAAGTNPASLSVDKGFGFETINWGPWWEVNLISGTGVIGSAFSTSNNEGTFFGNTSMETNEQYINRHFTDQKYKTKKINFMSAFSLIGVKKKKRSGLKVNLGIIAKYNKETKKLTGGGGLSFKLGPISAGASRSNEDYQNPHLGKREKYYVDSVTLGVQLASISLDWTYIKNHYSSPSEIRLLTGTFFMKKFMFTYGMRSEQSAYPVFAFEAQQLQVDQTDTRKDSSFLGVQYALNKQIIIGIFSNYYLMRELSLGMTAFF